MGTARLSARPSQRVRGIAEGNAHEADSDANLRQHHPRAATPEQAREQRRAANLSHAPVQVVKARHLRLHEHDDVRRVGATDVDVRRERRREDRAQLVLEQEAEDPGGDRADDEQPGELRVGVVLTDLAITKRATDALEDAGPIVPEEAEEHDRGREVRRDEERQEVLVILMDVPAKELRQDHAVPKARHREQFRDALKQPENDRSGIGDQRGEQDHVVLLFGPVWNQANANAARPTRNEAMPCFT